MTSIEWTDRTWNPVVGCSLVSAGCTNCYAMGVAHRGLSPDHRGLTVLRDHGKGPRWNGEVHDPVGRDNDRAIVECARVASLVVVGWGTHGRYLNRDRDVERLLLGNANVVPHCIGTTKDGDPRHPLYVRGTERPVPWRARGAS